MLQNPPANAQDLRDTGLIRKVRKVPWKGNDNPLQGKIDLIYACVQDLVFHYWADRDLRIAFSTHPESQASS